MSPFLNCFAARREGVNTGDIFATEGEERWSVELTVKGADIVAHLQKPNPGELASIWVRVEEGERILLMI